MPYGLPAVPQSAAADGQPVELGEYPATETTGAAPAVVVGVGFGKVRVELGPPAPEAPAA